MQTSTRSSTLILLAALAGGALAGCTAAPAQSDSTTATTEKTAQEVVQPVAQKADAAPSSSEPACSAPDGIALQDRGASALASGEADLDEQGLPIAYTVASGDSPIAIGERFCIDYIRMLQYNDTWPSIDPGEVLVLRTYLSDL